MASRSTTQNKRMKRSKLIHKSLERLFPVVEVPLTHHNTYTLLIAVLLSAQCTDERVNKVTPSLFKLADTAQKMIKLSIEQIREIIRPCGLSEKKASAIWNLSQILVEKYQGEVPNQMDLLEELPGVGHKTASVVMIQAFGVPAFPVDTHIHRLAKAWKLTEGKNVVQTENDLKKIFPESSWSKLHLQIIFYGRQYCTARQCDGMQCQLCQKLAKT